MAVNTHRIILIILTINIVLGILPTMYNNNNVFQSDSITGINQDNNEIYNNMKTDDILYGGTLNADGQTEEAAIGNPITLGTMIWKTLWNGIYPSSLLALPQTTTAEKWLVQAVTIFRWLIMMVLILEIYFVFKNKKTS